MSMIISEGSDIDVDEEALSLDEERTDSSGEGEHEDQTSTVTASLPAPRDHSYLDESHPLLPEDPALSRDYKRHRSSFDTTNQKDAASDSNSSPPNRNRDSFELAVLELRGVVLFPGSTIPIKLQNRSMIQYLGRQIQQCRTHPDVQPKVELGILTISEEHFHNRMEYLDWDARNFSSGFRLQRAQYMYSRMRGQLDQHRPSAQNPRYNENSSSSETVDPYIGRLGTIATIRHTHERTSSRTVGNVWSHYEDTDELVVTAVGTSRFRIINRIDERRFVFLVEELVDYAMARPYPQRLFSRNSSEQTTDDNFDTNIRLLRQSQLAWNVAQLTPLPYYVHQKFSPWCLMEKIRGVLRMNSGRNNLPALGAEDIGQQYLEPTQFSFWIANNAPLTESQRLNLLEIHSTLERLMMVWKEIQKMVDRPMVICCVVCNSILSFTKDVFTVGGAEGSTSTYVNGGGYIHQITTLRTLVDENKVVFEGFPSTENSYFPGYSWHITRCRRCAALLGWKFRRENGRSSGDVEAEDRPDTFFGFMSSIVTTKQMD